MNELSIKADDNDIDCNFCAVCKKICKCEDSCLFKNWCNKTYYITDGNNKCQLCKDCHSSYKKSKRIIKIILDEEKE
jgi:hypothetical protein